MSSEPSTHPGETPSADPWSGANPLDPAYRADPHPFLKRLRESDPVNQTPVGIWRLTRYADVERLLRDVPTGVRMSDGGTLRPSPVTGGPSEFMLSQDPPNHTRLRRLVSSAFTPTAVGRMREHVQEIVDRQIDRVLPAGRMDVIADLALPVPSTVICEMMAIPLEDRARFTDWTSDATHLLATIFSPPEVIERGIVAVEGLRAYFENLIAERRANLGTDLLSELIRAEEAGDRLSNSELIAQSIGLLIAGFETTIGLIGNGVLALLRHPEQLALLRARPELIAGAVEECLRYDGPILLTVRYLREDTEFGGTVIPKESMVWAMMSAAHRDPAAFPDPDRFDITRSGTPNLAFGGGIHYCLGAHLARMEAQAAIGTLVARCHDLELEDGELEWGRSLFRVLGRLPVRFRAPRRRAGRLVKPGENVRQAIDRVGAALAQALGTRAVCIAVYGSAASDEFSPAHSDVNLLLVLQEVAFADLRLIGATLEREATPELRIATPLVVTRHFLADARDSFPIELDDIRARHRVLHGDDVLADIRVRGDRLREQAEREARGKLLRLRALVVHRPPDDTLRLALASLVAVLGVIERALLRGASADHERGVTLFAEVERHAGARLRALPGLAAMREGRTAWPAGADLDDLLALVLHEVELLVRYVDSRADA